MSKQWIVLIGLTCVATSSAGATTARELLDQIRQLNQTTRTWNDRTQHLSLQIVDRLGGTRQRQLIMHFKKYPEERNRSLVFFEAPSEVRGVSVLQWTDPHAKDEQWLFMPALKRVRQISAAAKHESFVGTDFSYDDLAVISEITDWSEADAATKLLRDEDLAGKSCHVIEFTPAGKDIDYGKIVTWLSADDLVLLKFEMYDKSNKLEKVLTLSDVRDVGRIPTAFRWEMKNEENGSHTLVEFTEVKYNTALADEMFTQRTLERGL
ncbi:MAG TPA: outer membrane lipoprotein-sorting protein [Candidatus Margulisiibacteriota bacterium]|nr:outer membrane lipoprotein-sorting protein [Candidatus Margulisiibacteriota bacterium]